jgi:rod shape-determining protein MreD
MLKKISIFILFFFLVITQTSFLPLFFTSQRIPDIVLIVLIFLTVRRGFGEVWKMAILAGILMDIFSFSSVGMDVISFLLAVLISSFLARRFLVAYSNWKFVSLIFFVIVATVINDFTIAILMKAFLNVKDILGLGTFFSGIDLWMKIINNSLLLVVIYWPIAKLEKMKDIYGQKVTLRNNVR